MNSFGIGHKSVRRIGAFLALLLAACQSTGAARPILSTDVPSILSPSSAEWVQIYFSDPTNPESVSFRGGPDQALAGAIRQARLSVDLAVYDLDLWSIRDALIDARRRGVRVQMVTDSDNLAESEIQDLVASGIPVIGDRREGLMHDKFVILDGRDLWTGSMNFTLNSAYRNNDNLIQIHSAELSQDYLAEFNEMFSDDRFGPGSPANTPNPIVNIANHPIEVYFSPEDAVEDQILRLIRSAQKSIQFMAYSFTSDEIANAILERANAGVMVAGVLEEAQTHSNRGTKYDVLRAAGLDVRVDGNPANMHHKVILIDGQITLTGSYNFTNNARTINDENLLIIHDPQVTERYQEEFLKIFSQARP